MAIYAEADKLHEGARSVRYGCGDGDGRRLGEIALDKATERVTLVSGPDTILAHAVAPKIAVTWLQRGYGTRPAVGAGREEQLQPV
ncbi:hypothetical protein [Streptomyces cinnamoneus]|uniref:Uncharacterized protein n=1 Tax=Streptomyces cinnamoneus TaxID=53446 RepID=A0A918TZX5_STRCJ|nr:hypothetical protein [Streptomyces cinnamoneus]GHC72408.1 hypothetical protein GCM10010507_59440 [Streptomyces cinnamoneus]